MNRVGLARTGRRAGFFWLRFGVVFFWDLADEGLCVTVERFLAGFVAEAFLWVVLFVLDLSVTKFSGRFRESKDSISVLQSWNPCEGSH